LGPDLRRHLKENVAGLEVHSIDVNLEIGPAVAVHVALEHVVRCSELAHAMGKAMRADELEGLIAGMAAIGVDPSQIDHVILASMKIHDLVAVGSFAGFLHAVEVEYVIVGATGEPVFA
jgi:hypothetical protein